MYTIVNISERRIESAVEGAKQWSVCPFGQLVALQRLFPRLGDGLFAEDGLAGVQRVLHILLVRVGRRRDHTAMDVFVLTY